jgi:plasmid stabilization system protein ParE
LGAEFALELDALFDRIAHNPNQFPEVEEGVSRALLRRFPYAVYFVREERACAIIAVLHQHRRPDSWRTRRA